VSKSKVGLLQGTLDMLILKALSLGALHGYGVGQRIAQISDDSLKIEEGSLYPGLYRLERRGWVESEWDVSLDPVGRRVMVNGCTSLKKADQRWRGFFSQVIHNAAFLSIMEHF
jgi:PadR family transcriptional regulator PadR